ncbi:hypothetical protein F2P81_004228 [Scophthalmus maximus]|uniref:Tetraspanin-4 n=1 Tax=Scophthalmus maximus TaxID=52904 RepID=A0A6A4TJ52_SCOMX|nr:hypothetical protein F2P81_004228 [Scophthalmus maximus]
MNDCAPQHWYWSVPTVQLILPASFEPDHLHLVSRRGYAAVKKQSPEELRERLRIFALSIHITVSPTQASSYISDRGFSRHPLFLTSVSPFPIHMSLHLLSSPLLPIDHYAQRDLKKGLQLFGTEGNVGLTNAWMIVQTDFRCCGVTNHTDWFEVYNATRVPDSCCLEYSDNCGLDNPGTWWTAEQ